MTEQVKTSAFCELSDRTWTRSQVRVWWPPTKDRRKTDFSGMYWPAKVVKHTNDGYEVQYDNGDKESVLSENVSPFNPPFKFGDERCPLQVSFSSWSANSGILTRSTLSLLCKAGQNAQLTRSSNRSFARRTQKSACCSKRTCPVGRRVL